MRALSRSIGFVASSLVLAACAHYPKGGATPAPIGADLVQQAQTRWPDATEQSLAEGRELFVQRCQKCHDLPDRHAYDETRWPEILNEMAKKAKLDARQHESVLRFILVERTVR
jgi:cytochrome c5